MQEVSLQQSSVVAQKQEQTKELKAQIKNLQEQHKQQLEQLNQLKVENSKLNQELKTTKQVLGNQVIKIKEKEIRLQQLQQDHVELRSSQQHIKHLEQLNQQEVENSKLSQELKTTKQEQEKLANEIEDKEAIIQKLQQENEELKSSWVIKKKQIVLCEGEVGRGAYGWVKEATFQGCTVAVKCLHKLIISDYNSNLFDREMTMAARCRHPHLLQFIGATGKGDGEPFIVTELMQTSLHQILMHGKLSSDHIIPIMLGVALALNYLHNHEPPILHRDVSSANVLLNPLPSNQWFAKLSDFGSVNFLKRSQTSCAGNPAYAAPEASKTVSHSPAMDTFSYGVLLHELCSRTQPDEDNGLTPEKFKYAHWKAPESQLVSLIISCINQEIDKRPMMDTVVTQLKALQRS